MNQNLEKHKHVYQGVLISDRLPFCMKYHDKILSIYQQTFAKNVAPSRKVPLAVYTIF